MALAVSCGGATSAFGLQAAVAGASPAVRLEAAMQAASTASPCAAAGDAMWKSALAGDWAGLERTLSDLAGRPEAETRLAPHAQRLKEHLAKREEDRTKRMAEVRAELDKSLAGAQTDITLAKAIRSATELDMLSVDKAKVKKDPVLVDLVARATKAAHEAEARGDVFASYELFSLLGTFLEETGEFKPDVKRLSQRLDMLRLYVPETLWKLRNERQKASGDKELPPYNPFGDDYRTKLETIDRTMVIRALSRTAAHIERQRQNVVIGGGLDALKTMVTTKDLAAAFPKLADDLARAKMLNAIEEERRKLDDAERDYDATQLEMLLGRLATANDESTRIDSPALLHEFGNGAVGKLDEFSQIIWPDELRRFNKMTQSSFVGVGIQIEYDETSNVRVVSPLEGTPAQRAGVHPGDVLKKVDGRVIFGLSLDQAVDVITGPPGTDVTLTMLRKDPEKKDDKGEAVSHEIEFRLTRAVIKVPTAKGWSRSGIKEDDWNWFIDKESGIGYLRLTQFADNTGRELDDAVAAMKKEGLKGLIFDLRFNPGGLLDQAIRIGRRFVDSPNGFIVAMRGPDGIISNPEETMPDRARLAGIPLVVMVNEGSASASEIVSGALKCFQRGGSLDGKVDCVVLGARSFGKGSVQNVWPLTNNAAIKVTTQYYVIPDRTILHRRPGSERWGVEPNLAVEMLPKQTVDALLLRRNADVIPLDEKGQVVEDAAKPRPDPQDLLAKGLDLQLETAVMLMRGKIAATEPTQAAAK
ncbi:MAG: S41 family peptidase [Phycisphaerae bacterium]